MLQNTYCAKLLIYVQVQRYWDIFNTLFLPITSRYLSRTRYTVHIMIYIHNLALSKMYSIISLQAIVNIHCFLTWKPT